MNKFTKLTATSLLGLGLIELLRNFKQIRANVTQDRQLTNRLIEQVKGSRKSLTRLTKSLKTLNLSKINHQLNDFNDNLKPHLNQIQADLAKMKKNH